MNVSYDQIDIRLPRVPEEDKEAEPMTLDIKMCREVGDRDRERYRFLECLTEPGIEQPSLEASFVDLADIHIDEDSILRPRFV